MSPQIEFILPCFNESLAVEETVREAFSIISEHSLAGSVLVVDNNSTDDSAERAKAAGATVRACAAQGYGAAIREGINASSADIIVLTDADSTYDLRVVPAMLAQIVEGADLVIGCRFERGGGTIAAGSMPLLHRYLGNPVLSAIGRFATRTTVHDFHCGLRALRRSAVLPLRFECNGMDFASEMITVASDAKLSIAQLGVTLRRPKYKRKSKLRPLADGLAHCKVLLNHYVQREGSVRPNERRF